MVDQATLPRRAPPGFVSGHIGPGVQMGAAASDSVDFGKILGSLPQITVMTWVKFNGTAKGWDAVVGRGWHPGQWRRRGRERPARRSPG